MKRPCSIAEMRKKTRAGTSRFWCTTHGANATGRYGTRLDQCESAYREVDPDASFDLDVEAFPGGIALWAALPPVFNTTNEPPESGIHIHARKEDGEFKDIDGTYPSVTVPLRRDLFDEQKAVITSETGVSYYISRFLGHSPTCLFCTYCGEPHLDAEFFATKPHKKHLCHGCGEYFQAANRGISNPLALVRQKVQLGQENSEPVPATRTFDAAQSDYPGGLQLWASNPAIFWLRAEPEKSGIHLHAYDELGRRVEDDTFAHIRIDGVDLPQEQVAYLMAQNALQFLRGKIVSLNCPSCQEAIFDRGTLAFEPHKEHNCSCGATFTTPGNPKLVVCNPLVRVLETLYRGAARRKGQH